MATAHAAQALSFAKVLYGVSTDPSMTICIHQMVPIKIWEIKLNCKWISNHQNFPTKPPAVLILQTFYCQSFLLYCISAS